MHRRAFLISLCMVAVAVRLATGGTLLSQGGPAFVLSSDDGDAYDAAARWQAFGTPIVMTERMGGKWDPVVPVEARWPQGYWLLLAAQYRVFGSAAYASTLVVQAVLAAGGVLAVFGLAARVFSEPAARVAAVGQALSSTGVYLSSALYAESLYLPMLLGGLALIALAVEATSAARPRCLLALGAGAAFGVAEATRPLALPVFAMAVVWAAVATRPTSERRRIVLVLGAGFCLALLPLVLHDLATLGRVAVFTAGGAEAVRDQSAHGEGLFERALTMFITGGWAPLGEPLISSLGPLPTLFGRLGEWLLAVVGGVWLLFVSRRRGVTRVGWLLAGGAAAVIGPSLLVGLPLVRYRAAADPIFIICMVAGALALNVRRFPRGTPKGHVRGAVLVR